MDVCTSLHIRTDHAPTLAQSWWRSIKKEDGEDNFLRDVVNGFNEMENTSFRLSAMKTSRLVIQYDNILSRFENYDTTGECLVKSISRRYKTTTIYSLVGWRTDSNGQEEEVFILLVGDAGECVAQGFSNVTINVGRRGELKIPDYYNFTQRFPLSPPVSEEQWTKIWNEETPIQIAHILGKHLGINLGDKSLPSFLGEKCSLQKETWRSKIYNYIG